MDYKIEKYLNIEISINYKILKYSKTFYKVFKV